MNKYIGIDLGTSGTKILLVNACGEVEKEVTKNYGVSYPKEGWSEQSPESWLTAAYEGVRELMDGVCADDVKGISFGGQMHGLVILDENDEVIRPCILWNDGRTQAQTDYLNTVIGKEKLSEYTGNIAFAGFTAPKILWVKENEPENFAKIAKIMLPKDYLAYKLTGVHSTDYSDASGMLLLDVQNKCWSAEMCDICSVKAEWLPKLYESYDVIGTLTKNAAKELGLSEGVIVTAGAGDNAAAAIGTGTVGGGACNISLGTSGTIFISGNSFSVDAKNALHSFAHADGKWHLMGCILSAASCRKWWLEDVLGTCDYAGDEKEAACGESGVIYLPYLMGERSPHNDVDAKGAFIGLNAATTKGQMSRAVMEGVAFALKDCMEIAKAQGIDVKKTRICGGGAKSAVWKQIVANVLEIPVESLVTEQGPAYGAAMLAMVAAGEYADVIEAASKVVKAKDTVYPEENTEYYRKKYENFRRIYPALKEIFASM